MNSNLEKARDLLDRLIHEDRAHTFAVRSVNRPKREDKKQWIFTSKSHGLGRCLRATTKIGAMRAWYALAFPQYFDERSSPHLTERDILGIMDRKGYEMAELE